VGERLRSHAAAKALLISQSVLSRRRDMIEDANSAPVEPRAQRRAEARIRSMKSSSALRGP
jgi:hypothetical protein